VVMCYDLDALAGDAHMITQLGQAGRVSWDFDIHEEA